MVLLSKVRSISVSQGGLWERQVTGDLRENGEEGERNLDNGTLGSEEISAT